MYKAALAPYLQCLCVENQCIVQNVTGKFTYIVLILCHSTNNYYIVICLVLCIVVVSYMNLI